jgi:AraC-like DNA-binding protein
MNPDLTNPIKDNQKTVPAKFARSLLLFLEEQGCDMDRIIEAVELPFDPRHTAGDDREVPAMCYSRLYQWAMWMVQDESFGLHAKGVRPLGTFRMMTYSLINCKNLEHAMNRAADFNEILKATRDPGRESRRRHSRHPNGWPLLVREELNEVESGAEREPQLVATYFYDTDFHSAEETDWSLLGIASGLSIWHRFCSWLIDKPIELLEVHFAQDAPPNLEKYQHFFNCTLKFNQPENGFRFSADYLDYPVLQNEDSLKQFLRNAPFQLITMPNHGDSVVSQIRALIGHDFSKKFPSFEQITAQLNTSATTLRRRLRSEGTTYQQIKDNTRRDAAMGYLSRPELSIGAVAALMGFTDTSSFHRSFKKWTGSTPKEYRDNYAGNDASVDARQINKKAS